MIKGEEVQDTLLFGTGLTAYAYAQGQLSDQFPQSIVVFSNTDPTPHALELAAIQQGNAESSEVSGLSLDATNNTVGLSLTPALCTQLTHLT